MRESFAIRHSAVSLTAVDAASSRGSDAGTPSRLLSSSTQQSSVSTGGVFSPPRGSPVIPRRSLRENLTGQDDLDRVSQHGRSSFSVKGESGGGVGFIGSLGGLRRMPSINNTIDFDSRPTSSRVVDPVVVVNPMIDDGSTEEEEESDRHDNADADDKI